MARRKRLTRRRRSRQFRGRQRFKTMRRRVKRGRIRRYTKVGKFRGGTSKQITRRCRKYCRRKGKRGGMEKQGPGGEQTCFDVCVKNKTKDGGPTKGGSLDQAIKDGNITKVTKLNEQNALNGVIDEVNEHVTEDKDGLLAKLTELNTANTEINKLMAGGAKNDIKAFVEWTEAGENLTNAATAGAVWDKGDPLKKKADEAIAKIKFQKEDLTLLNKIPGITDLYDGSNFKQYVEILTKFKSITWPPRPGG